MKRPITPRGYQQLKEELQRLKSNRGELSQAIEVARGHGDLSENADYEAAKNAAALNDARQRDLESRLSQVQVIDPTSLKTPGKVVFGVAVRIADVDSGEEKSYKIYGPDESDASKGWISIETPLATALLGKSVGDTATVKLPSGKREYEVLDIFIEYP
jgi:transcription elongation factor GreA